MSIANSILKFVAGMGIFYYGTYHNQMNKGLGDWLYLLIGIFIWIAYYGLLELGERLRR